ncbi:hypothetical protein ROR02_17720 [Pararhodospirillum oryzae]|uniref:Uncharacterized protein n=1 Tax=Pararhodospirillum oryzae TaxID=478448 RepID=A0A512H877_9PROT|nr:hypothetical protein ROR02_17720 [Pararhodospirillum oryzae]
MSISRNMSGVRSKAQYDGSAGHAGATRRALAPRLPRAVRVPLPGAGVKHRGIRFAPASGGGTETVACTDRAALPEGGACVSLGRFFLWWRRVPALAILVPSLE